MKDFSLHLEYCIHYISNVWNYPWNLYPFHQLYFVDTGDGWVETINGLTHIEGGYAYLIPQLTPYMCWSDHLIDKVYCGVSVTTDKGISVPYEANHVQRIPYSKEEFERFLTADVRSISGQMWIQSEILRVMSQFDVAQEINSSPNLMSAVSYIEKNLNMDLRIADIAEKNGMTQVSFTRSFKKTYGISVKKYIDMRLAHILENDLLNSTSTLAELAEKYHFCDAYYLSAFFKRNTGTSPENYRNGKISQAKKEDSEIVKKKYETSRKTFGRIISKTSIGSNKEIESVYSEEINGLTRRVEID